MRFYERFLDFRALRIMGKCSVAIFFGTVACRDIFVVQTDDENGKN